ncbi:MAG TPA: hypothetical protein VFA28_21215 [Bryobacteraceae bacterium]|nr:hypothetical protein [Bryobacteraceae bacterium]
MAELDEVLERIDNQLNKMKKSLRNRNRALIQATISQAQAKHSAQARGKNLHGTPADTPTHSRHAVESRPQR